VRLTSARMAIFVDTGASLLATANDQRSSSRDGMTP
jgi:hypothetical protein